MSAGTALRTARSVAVLAAEATRYAADRVVPSAGGVPDDSGAVTPRWLEHAMDLPTGAIDSVTILEEHHGTASRARLALTGDSLVPKHVFVKLAPRTLGGRLFMNTMGLGEREVRFYQEVADELPVRVPRCYAAVVDHRRGRNAIVLEDLADTAVFRDITDSCTLDEARTVVEALAHLHGVFWTSSRFSTDLQTWATPHNTAGAVLAGVLVRRVIERPRGLVADLVPAAVQRDSLVLVERGAELAAFWASEPMTFTHNDTHLGNLFFEHGRPGFLDWQNASVGRGIRDVAYFVLPSLEPAVARSAERDLVRTYVERLASHGVDYPQDRAWRGYRAAASQFYVGAVVTAAFGDRMQREPIARAGVERAVAAVRDLHSFELLRDLAATTGTA